MLRKAISILGVSLAVLFIGARCQAGAVPSVTSLSTARLGESTVLTVTGSGFTTASQVQVNGANRPTIFLSPLQLKATLFASDLASGFPLRVTVANAMLISNVIPLAPLPL